MTITSSRIKVGGSELPIDTHYQSCIVQVARDAQGRRKVLINASGAYPPDLSLVAWSGAVSVAWRDLGNVDAEWTELSLLSAGPQLSSDFSGSVSCSWTLSGVESNEAGANVTIDSVPYWAQVTRDPIGGVIQRKTNGAGTLLRAWAGKYRVTLRGESIAAPVCSGVVAIVSGVYSGNLLVAGVSASSNADTGLQSWSFTGEQP